MRQRIKRLRLERALSQRELSAPGISYAYIPRVDADARTPSVKALRRIATKLGVTVERMERGEPTPTELGVADDVAVIPCALQHEEQLVSSARLCGGVER